MRISVLVLFACLTVFAVPAFGQHGGKAMPREIKFAPHSSSATMTGTLSNGQEYDFIFSARKGQQVTITNSRTNLFDVRVFNEEFDLDTEFVSARKLRFEIPETGDYLLFVRKKMGKTPRTARFSLTLSIK